MPHVWPVLDCLQDCFDPISQSELEKLQIDPGITLPTDYRDFLLAYNAGYWAHEVALRVRHPTPFIEECYLSHTSGIVADEQFGHCDIRWNLECNQDYIPPNLLPIGDTYASPICLGTGGANYGKTFVWRRNDDELHIVADSFTEFLFRLYRLPEECVEESQIFRAIERGDLPRVQQFLPAFPR